jgi:uncharacterized repeat protein (TIGR01451 family)
MKRLLASLLMLFAGAWLTSAAYAYPVNQCAADRYGDDLGCTAGDVSITGMAVIGDTTSCIGGSPVTLDLQLTVNFAVPDRWDIGIFISNDGNDPQIMVANGGAASCAVSVLPNSSPFLDLDGPTDTCGDGNGTIGGGSGSGIHYMNNVTVPCQSLAGAGGNLYIPFVVSWDNQKTPPGTVCTSNADPVPNTKSKCNSPTIVQGSVAVVVMPTITKTDNKTTLFSGDTTNYTVTINNSTGATLSGAVFTDPVVTGIAANSVSCSASGGASCPTSSTVAEMQGAGITIPDMPVDGSVTFTIGATLTGSPGDTRTNTATVRVGSQSSSESDTDTIVDSIAILPITQSKTGAKGGTVTYSHTLYNFGLTADTITLAAVSSNGWTIAASPTSVTVPAGGSITVTLAVTIPNGASAGDVDSTTITATSGLNPMKTATATAFTTVTKALTLIPSNTGAGGAGSSTYYSHQVQNNASTSKDISLTPVLSGTCTGWTSALFSSDETTPLSTPVTLSANGDFMNFVLKISIPVNAVAADICTATLTAQYTSGAANAVSVTDVTTVKNLLLYKDPGYTSESYVYPAGNNVFAKGFGLDSMKNYEYRWFDSSGAEVCTPRTASTTGTFFPDTCQIPVAGPLGTWTVQIWNTTNNASFAQTDFYVGPDHLNANYSGADPPVNTNAVIDLELHDKFNHLVPKDAAGNLVTGSPTDPEGPLMITATVSGSATIVSTTLTNAVITGQSVTGKLDSTTGMATLTISNTVAESVTITPVSYKGVLDGSPLGDEPATVIFIVSSPGPDHYELSLPTNGITCLPTTATVTACADNSSPCTTPLAAVSGETATLTASAGTLTATTVIFNASGVASTTLSYPAAADNTSVSVTLSNEQSSAGNQRQCCPDGINCVAADSCTTTFNTAGFIFSNSAGGGVATIPSQVAGTPSGAYYLRAVKTNTITKACEAALVGTNAINFAYECHDPATCYAANLMSVNGGSATTIARNNNGSVSTYTSVNMAFDVNGNAPLTFNYDDVGTVTLHTDKTVNSAGMTGSSNAFVVKPFDLRVTPCATSVIGNCLTAPLDPGLSGLGDSFSKAGETFKATVTARTASGTATPSFGFGSNNGTETVDLTHNRVAPFGVGTTDGTLSGTTSIFRSSFTDGSATVSDLAWSEVGVITLTGTNSAFLGNALTSTGTSDNLGRFIPDHFAITPGSVIEGCDAGDFTYFDQDGFATAFTLTAQNQTPATTMNYTGAFAKLDLTDWNNFTFTATGLPGGATLAGSATAPTGSWSNGTAVVNAKHQVSRPAAPAAPADITINAKPTDPDGVTTVSAVAVHAATTALRYGRLVLQNAFGPETETLAMPLTVQYYDGTTFQTNDLDPCTTLSVLPASPPQWGNILLPPASYTDNLEAGETAPTYTSFADGTGVIILSAPGLGNEGNVGVTIDLTGAGLPWLQYDWDDLDGSANGPYDGNPSAIATFGIYRGNDRFINWREIMR